MIPNSNVVPSLNVEGVYEARLLLPIFGRITKNDTLDYIFRKIYSSDKDERDKRNRETVNKNNKQTQT